MKLPDHHTHLHGDHAHSHAHGDHPHIHGEHSHGEHEDSGLNRRGFLGSLGIVAAAMRLHAQSKAAPDPQMDRGLADAANNFLNALRPELRAKYGFAFDDSYRKDWNNLPYFVHPRK